jgi:putative flippase GtrA
MFGQFFLFAGVGAVGTVAHYTVLIALVQLAKLNAIHASSIGFLVGAGINYTLNYYYTFRSSKRHHQALIMFLTVAGVGLVLNGAILHAFTHGLGAHYLVGQVFATAFVLVWNFFGNRLWTFRQT